MILTQAIRSWITDMAKTVLSLSLFVCVCGLVPATLFALWYYQTVLIQNFWIENEWFVLHPKLMSLANCYTIDNENIWTLLAKARRRRPHFLILSGIQFVVFYVPNQFKEWIPFVLTENHYSAHSKMNEQKWVNKWMNGLKIIRFNWSNNSRQRIFLWWKCLYGSLLCILIFWKENISVCYTRNFGYVVTTLI